MGGGACFTSGPAGGACFTSGPLAGLGAGPSVPPIGPPPGPPGSPLAAAPAVMNQGSPILSWQPMSPSQAPSHPATPGARPPTFAPPSHPAPALAAHGALLHELGNLDPPARDAVLLPPSAAPGLGAAPATAPSLDAHRADSSPVALAR